MWLSWLELSGFRSYGSLEFRPDPGLNVLVGPNGSGKTNVLEAVGYLSSLRSFRGAPDASLIRAGAEGAILRGGFRRESGEVRVEVEVPAAGRRRVLVNGKRPRRNSDVAAEVPLVAFLPDDLDLVKRGPGLRRGYLDDLLGSLSATAGADLADYDRTLRQRNSLLRSQGRMVGESELAVWDERLSELGGRVLANRLDLVERTGPVLAEAYASVGGGSGRVGWRYRASWHATWGEVIEPVPATELASRLRRALGERRRRDLDQRTTTAGPHRDDPELVLDGREVRTMASQGEQRSVALALRLVAYRLLEDRHDRPPILLLDDVFSELDAQRSRRVVDLLPRGQVFVTTAREDEVPATGRRWEVAPGRVAG
jgi:DNA replication and repair protein RecF